MSTSTLVFGRFKFKEGVPDELKKKVIEELEDVLEAKLAWDERWNEYGVNNVNWTSHITIDDLERIHRKWKFLFAKYDLTMYYLTEPDYTQYDNDENKYGNINSVLEGGIDWIRLDINDLLDVSESVDGWLEFVESCLLKNEVGIQEVDNLLKELIRVLPEAIQRHLLNYQAFERIIMFLKTWRFESTMVTFRETTNVLIDAIFSAIKNWKKETIFGHERFVYKYNITDHVMMLSVLINNFDVDLGTVASKIKDVVDNISEAIRNEYLEREVVLDLIKTLESFDISSIGLKTALFFSTI